MVDEEESVKSNWSITINYSVDIELTKTLPINMMRGSGEDFVMSVCFDSYYAGNSMTRGSQTGYFVYLNLALI